MSELPDKDIFAVLRFEPSTNQNSLRRKINKRHLNGKETKQYFL